MAHKNCKRCGTTIYFQSDYCLNCAEDIELERLSHLDKSDLDKEYSLIIDDLLTNGKFTSESKSRLRRLMMIDEKINQNLQALCTKLGLSDIPVVYYGANEKIINDLAQLKNSKNPKDYGLEICYDVATSKEDWLNICDKDCYELIADDFQVDELSSKIKLRILNIDGKTYQIEDLFKCLDEDMIEERKGDTVITFRAKNKVSPFLPRFNDKSNTVGGYLCEDFDNKYDECDKCDEEMHHLAQLNAKQFGLGEGCFQLSICRTCGNIQVRYEQT